MSDLETYRNPNKAKSRLKYQTDKDDNMSSIHFLMILLYFVSLFLLFNYFRKTIMDLLSLFSLFVLFAAAAFLVPISIYRRKFTMSYYEFSLLNIMGIAPILTSLLLLLNFYIVSGMKTEKYKIIKREISRKEIVLYLENNALNEQEFLRTIADEEMHQYPISYSDSLSLTIADGLFGYKVVKSREY